MHAATHSPAPLPSPLSPPQLDADGWSRLMAACREVQSNAQFLPQDPVPTPPNEAEEEQANA